MSHTSDKLLCVKWALVLVFTGSPCIMDLIGGMATVHNLMVIVCDANWTI